MDLRPARTDEAGTVGIVGDEEPVELDPLRRHALAELLDRPPTLFGVAGKRPVVGVDPCLLVAAGHEGAGRQGPGRRHDIGRERQGDTHLEEVALGDESVRAGVVVVGGTGVHGPEMDGSVGRRLGHGAPDQSGHDCVIGAVSPGGGIRGDVEHGGAVLGGREQGEPDESAPVAGEHGAVLRRRRARMRDGEQLRLRECSVAACPRRPGPGAQESSARTVSPRWSRSTVTMCSTSTPANVTRYRERVAKPRTPKGRARLTVERLAERYPGTARQLCALDFQNPFQLLVATILSRAVHRCTRVNMVTPVLFAAYPDPASLAVANPEDVEEIIRSTGFFRSKTKSLVGHGRCRRAIATAARSRRELEELVTIPGVGRKTGNVVRSVAFGLPGLPVDTHVLRVSQRLGLLEGLAPAEQHDAVKVERQLNELIPAADRGAFSLRVILLGRETCVARKPLHAACPLADFCPSVR